MGKEGREEGYRGGDEGEMWMYTLEEKEKWILELFIWGCWGRKLDGQSEGGKRLRPL